MFSSCVSNWLCIYVCFVCHLKRSEVKNKCEDLTKLSYKVQLPPHNTVAVAFADFAPLAFISTYSGPSLIQTAWDEPGEISEIIGQVRLVSRTHHTTTLSMYLQIPATQIQGEGGRGTHLQTPWRSVCGGWWSVGGGRGVQHQTYRPDRLQAEECHSTLDH